MNKDIIRQWVNVATLLATVVVNGLANALPLNGQETGEISDRFAIYFVPAGYVFSIWGVIYLGLIAFTIYQLLPSQRENPRLRSIGYWFAVANLANAIWVFLWHYNVFSLTLVAMLVLLASLLVIYLRLNIGRVKTSTTERWLVDIPFSVYLGWITVATIANVTQLLYWVGWNGWGIAPDVWAAIMLLVAVVVAGAMSWTRGDVAYLLVLVWAFIGIAVKHAGVALVATVAWAAVGLVLVAGILAFWRARQLLSA